MKIREIKAKSIITKSNLPDADFVINPYTGCSHGCIYCYARFMKRFSGHSEAWGDFVDVKINASELISENTEKYKGKRLVIGSVTDPYQVLEGKYRLTRQILKKLIPLKMSFDIITKSDLVVRDIDLLKQFKNLNVVISFSNLDDKVRTKLEPGSVSVNKKIAALKELHQSGVYTTVFVSPILPEITDWQKIIKKTKLFASGYWFENLNLYQPIKNNVLEFLKDYNFNLVEKYENIYSKGSDYWDNVKEEIENFCKKEKINHKIYFDHKT